MLIVSIRQPPSRARYRELVNECWRLIQFHTALTSSLRALRSNPFLRAKEEWIASSHPLPHKELSSSGLTGRSSTPQPLDLFSGVAGILDSHFRGNDDLVRRHTSAFPRRDAPELCMNLPPKEGVGNAGRTM